MGNYLCCCPRRHQAKLDLDVAKDLESRTTFTYEEINTLFKTFQTEFPNLRMTKTQFIEKIEQDVLPVGDCHQFANYLYKIFDENDDGSIDFSEFIFGLYLLTSATGKERLNFAFNMLDINSDGYITKTEMAQVLEAYSVFTKNSSKNRETPEYLTNLIFKTIDTDRDQRISLQEFEEAAEKHPRLLEFLAL